MKCSLAATAVAGMTLLLTAAFAPALAGSGQFRPSQDNCAPGRPACVCPPGRPGCQHPSPGHRPGGGHGYWYGDRPGGGHDDWYGDRPGGYYYHRPGGGYRMSCSSAMNKLSNRGYHGIVAKDCSGKRYNFTARKNGRRFWISFNARTGRFTRSVN